MTEPIQRIQEYHQYVYNLRYYTIYKFPHQKMLERHQIIYYIDKYQLI